MGAQRTTFDCILYIFVFRAVCIPIYTLPAWRTIISRYLILIFLHYCLCTLKSSVLAGSSSIMLCSIRINININIIINNTFTLMKLN